MHFVSVPPHLPAASGERKKNKPNKKKTTQRSLTVTCSCTSVHEMYQTLWLILAVHRHFSRYLAASSAFRLVTFILSHSSALETAGGFRSNAA